MAAYAPIAGLREHMRNKAVDEAIEAVNLTSKASKLIDSSLRNLDLIRTALPFRQ
jgi:hypothetical protein